jgi:Putative zinc-finger
MSEREQNKPSGEPGRGLRCDEWENLIADALDGTLTAADAAAFTRHHSECALCAQMLKEIQQGKAWLEYLAVEPEVPAELFQKILARTSERQAAGADAGADPGVAPGIAMPVRALPARPAWYRVVLPVVRQALEPRLMMTTAMAFFSIALTLNLTGIKVTQLRADDLRPARVRANLTRQFYSTNEQVMKYYENLRLVYEMEARVRELRRSTEAEPATVQSPRETPKQPARDGSGSPSSTAPSGGQGLPVPQGRRTPLSGDPSSPTMMVQAVPQADAERPTRVPASFDRAGRKGKVEREVFRALRSTTEDQAERSLV